jgi:hypothetical protein
MRRLRRGVCPCGNAFALQCWIFGGNKGAVQAVIFLFFILFYFIFNYFLLFIFLAAPVAMLFHSSPPKTK